MLKLRQEYSKWNRQTNNSNERTSKKDGGICLEMRKIWLLMNLLDKFRYSKDDPGQLRAI